MWYITYNVYATGMPWVFIEESEQHGCSGEWLGRGPLCAQCESRPDPNAGAFLTLAETREILIRAFIYLWRHSSLFEYGSWFLYRYRPVRTPRCWHKECVDHMFSLLCFCTNHSNNFIDVDIYYFLIVFVYKKQYLFGSINSFIFLYHVKT